MFLEFYLNGLRLALPAAGVVEVHPAVEITPLPGAPAGVEGVIDVHGALTPALDLRQRFGLPPRANSPDQHLVIARAGGRTVAARVDEARALTSVDAARVTEAAALARGVRHVSGAASLPDGIVVIQDLGAFLDSDELLQLEQALAEAAWTSQT